MPDSILDSFPNALSAYPAFVSSRAKRMPSDIEDYLHGVLGLTTEIGELGDTIKKQFIYGKEMDKENLLEEAGDLLFYLQIILNKLGLNLETVATYDILKLEKRYPQGYSDAAALARADKVEA